MEKILWALILFWNVENYFAPFDFSEPHFRTVSQSGNTFEQSRKFRNWNAFLHKRDGIAKTLCLVAERCGRFPDLIGLAELENRWVLKQLTQNTVLAMQDYGIVHKDSPDSRGIDVALLYRRSSFRPLSVRFIPIIVASFNGSTDTLSSHKQVSCYEKTAEACLDNETACESTVPSKKILKNRPNGHRGNSRNDTREDTLKTREILYVKGVLRGYDTLHLFVNHWPSKLGGRTAQNHRCEIARKLKWLCDSIAASVEGVGGSEGRREKVWHGAKIVIMGDFNAGAGDAALSILDGSDCAVSSIAGGKEPSDMFEKADLDKEDALLIDMSDGCFQKNGRMPGQWSDMCAEINRTARINSRYNVKSVRNVDYEREVHGSYKYKGEWSTIDRFYVSRYFVEDKEISAGKAEIFSHPFLLEEDKTYLGVKPRRSFIGPRFNGGLSDHLPIILSLFSLHF